MKMFVSICGGAALCYAVLASQQTRAADVPPPGTSQSSTAAADTDSLTEVIVTAERRSENLQSTPIALTALKGSELESAGVFNVTDLQFVAPSLSVTQIGFTTNINIRGIGLNVQSPTVVPGVAQYRDGLFSPSTTLGDLPYYDVKDIEVLRGPQGTFIGQNSTGGAILVSSNSPTFDGTHGNAEVQVGNYEDTVFRAAINLPINEQWAARIALFHEGRDSFFTNLGSPSSTPGNVDQTSFRASLLWAPNDQFSALSKTEYTINRSDGTPEIPIPGSAYSGLAPTHAYTLDYNQGDTRYNYNAIRSGLELKYAFDSGLSIRSIGGYQYSYLNQVLDVDATAAPIPTSTLPGQSRLGFLSNERIVTEEVDLLSADTGALRWIVGGTYVHRWSPVLFENVTYAPAGPITQTVAADFDDPSTGLGIFGHATYDIDSTFQLEAGLRYSHDKTDESGGFAGGNALIITPPGIELTNPGRYTDHKITGKLSLNVTVDPDDHLYLFAASGFKPGGPNLANAILYQPETVWDYETGWKSSFADDHIRTQLGAFYMNYKEFQLSVYNPETQNTAEANLSGTSTIYGLEGQAQGRLGPWGLTLSGSYVHSKLGAGRLIDTRNLPNGGNGLGSQCAPGVPSGTGCFDYGPYFSDVSGSKNPYSPLYSGNVALTYDIHLGNGTLTPRADFSYIASQFTTVFNNPALDELSARHLLNAQIQYLNNGWGVALYSTNLTNQYYVSGQDGNNETLGNPRQFGIRVSKDF